MERYFALISLPDILREYRKKFVFSEPWYFLRVPNDVGCSLHLSVGL